MKKLVWFFAFFIAVAFSSSVFAVDGAALFGAKCRMCHGVSGSGTPMGPKLAGTDIVKDGAALKAIIKSGVPKAAKKYPNFPMAMPQIILSDGEVDAVVGYLQSL